MGNNYRFKLSDMIPNAWFYKLRDMGKSRKQTSTTTTTTTTSQSRKKKQSSSKPTSSNKHSSKPKQPHQYHNPRKSYYFTRDLNLNTSPPNNKKVLHSNFHEPPRKSTKQNFHEPPRKSTKHIAKRRTSKTSNSPKHSYSSTPLELEFHDPEFRTDSVLLPTDQSLGLFDEMISLSNNHSSCGCRVLNDDIIIDVDNNSIARKDDKLEGGCVDSFSEHVLPPIVTKPRAKFNDLLGDDAKNKNKKETIPRSRMVTHSPSVGGGRRLRLRINSPRIRSWKSVSSAAGGRRSLLDSFAIVKSSFNPLRDFRESMVEMIVQNNIRSSKDLEDLLACYLSLNSDEYHDLIIKVFKQIWFDLTDNE